MPPTIPTRIYCFDCGAGASPASGGIIQHHAGCAEALRQAARTIDLSAADGLIDPADAAKLYGFLSSGPVLAPDLYTAHRAASCTCGDGNRAQGVHALPCPWAPRPAHRVRGYWG